MTSNRRSLHEDLDLIFAPYTTGVKPPATGYRVLGVDLIHRYAPRYSGEMVPATGYKYAGVDLNEIFAPYGALVSPLDFDGAHYDTEVEVGGSADIYAPIWFQLFENGTYEFTDTYGLLASGNWFAPPRDGISDGFEVRFTVTRHAAPGPGTLAGITNPATDWTPISGIDPLEVLAHWFGADGDTLQRFTVVVDIRPTGGAIGTTGTFVASCTAARDTGL